MHGNLSLVPLLTLSVAAHDAKHTCMMPQRSALQPATFELEFKEQMQLVKQPGDQRCPAVGARQCPGTLLAKHCKMSLCSRRAWKLSAKAFVRHTYAVCFKVASQSLCNAAGISVTQQDSRLTRRAPRLRWPGRHAAQSDCCIVDLFPCRLILRRQLRQCTGLCLQRVWPSQVVSNGLRYDIHHHCNC